MSWICHRHRAGRPALACAVALLAAMLSGACDPNPERCAVLCGAAGDCPEGHACGTDGYCYSREDPGALCSAAGRDAAPTSDGMPGEADAGLLAVDQPCAADESCMADLVCADPGVGGAHCMPTCGPEEECLGVRSRCSRMDVDTNVMVCSSNCDPLGEGECGAGEKCLLSRATDGRLDVLCAAHGGQGYQESCEISADCGPGLICIGTAPDRVCEDLCVVGDTVCDVNFTCASVAGDNELAGDEYSYCQPSLLTRRPLPLEQDDPALASRP